MKQQNAFQKNETRQLIIVIGFVLLVFISDFRYFEIPIGAEQFGAAINTVANGVVSMFFAAIVFFAVCPRDTIGKVILSFVILYSFFFGARLDVYFNLPFLENHLLIKAINGLFACGALLLVFGLFSFLSKPKKKED